MGTFREGSYPPVIDDATGANGSIDGRVSKGYTWESPYYTGHTAIAIASNAFSGAAAADRSAVMLEAAPQNYRYAVTLGGTIPDALMYMRGRAQQSSFPVASSAADDLTALIRTAGVDLQRRIAGTNTTLGSVTAATWATGDKLCGEVIETGNGTWQTVWQFDASAGTLTYLGHVFDSVAGRPSAAGRMAMEIENTTATFDDYSFEGIPDIDTPHYVGGVSATGNNTTSANWTLPSSWKAGDVAIFWWYTLDSTKTITQSTVTSKREASSAGFGRLFIGYRVLAPGDSTFAWTSSSVANSDVIYGTDVFRNVWTTGDPFEAESGAPATFANTSSPDPAAATSVTPFGVAVTIFGKNNDYTTLTPPSGYRTGQANTSTAGTDASAGLAYKVAPAAGSQNPGAWAAAGAATDDGYTWTGILKPSYYVPSGPGINHQNPAVL